MSGGDQVESVAARRWRRRRAGLSLVEVLMALVILGTGLVVLIAAASRCVAVVRKVRNLETTRELFGRVEVEKPIWVEEDIEDAAGQGSFTGEYSQYRWRRDIEGVGDEDDGLWLVTTTISWSDRGMENSETVVTYVHWPKTN
ncbi:MAG: prepilin-type N-terminal cleavage/methylation domain-containing protein [Kiritimatiellae bacterium]|nr:prepilin-type N-terminal cleavage/methylation domain-containing protein [Kiritimatiellia bacterium]MCO6401243.1 prepilin-type N-terminal cleavage/methylation domain-containing protein [Verrucomicrobiota bacterium]